MSERGRVGLFGGTFNPIHLGHLRGAEEVREHFRLRKVVFIPSFIPPHKPLEEVADPGSRLEMVKLAIAGNPFFCVSELELERSGKSFTIDTLRHFSGTMADSLYFILGEDAFSEIETWKDYRDLFWISNFIVMTTAGSEKPDGNRRIPESIRRLFRYEERSGCWVHESGNTLHFKEIVFLDISSTAIRKMLRQGKSVRYLVPPAVEVYLKEHGLYSAAPASTKVR